MQTIQLDISRKTEIAVVQAKQDDVGREFQAVILDNGEPYYIPQKAVISLWYSGASGEGNYTEIQGKKPFLVNGNTVTVELISQMLRLPGGGQMCLVVLDEEGNQLGLWNIPYHVEKIPGMGSKGAEEYFSALTKIIQAIEVDSSLSIAGRPADAKAVGDVLQRIALGDGLILNGGVVGSLEELSDLVYATLTGMPAPSTLQLSVNCDFDHQASCGNLTLYKTMGFDSAYEATATLVTTAGDILIGTTLDDSLEGEWLPIEWAWSNPPMEVDEEYQTTERYMGYPVYTKLIFFGTLPNGAAKQYAHGIALSQVLRCSAHIVGGDSLPAALSANNYRATAYCNQQYIVIDTAGNMSGQTAYAQIWYTKG